jgi:transposase InsO family protein
MPWKEMDIMNQRIEFVARAVKGNMNISSLSREYDIARSTGYRWINRFHEVGTFARLTEKSKRPHTSPNRINAELEAQVIELRKKRGWGGKKLQKIMADEGIPMSVSTINRIIKRNNLLEANECTKQATKRFEMEHPNDLWQMDFKGEWPIMEGKCYPLSIIDDCSRYAVGLFALTNQRSVSVKECVEKTFNEYGVPDAMLMDHGTPWWSTANSLGLTNFAVFLIKQGIDLIYSGVGHPQTQGKVERFHRTLKHSIYRKGRPDTHQKCKVMLHEFVEEYNEIRPHEALGMDVPAQRYKRSNREYNPNPPEYEYQIGGQVTKLNSQGCVKYLSRRYFVSEALSEEWVQVDEINGKLLVKYRHMYVREIDIRSGSTTAVVLPERSL